MRFNEALANRVREIIAAKETNVAEKIMFSGICFMVNDKLCVAVGKDRMLVRLAPEIYEDALEQDGCSPMERNGTAMKGYVYVNEDILATKKKLEHWVNLALDFNQFAKSSKKKK